MEHRTHSHWLVGVAVMLLSATIYAQDDPASARRELLSRAEVAAREGRAANALALAQQAAALRMTPSLRLFIAQQHSALNRPATAMASAEACVREALQDQALPNREAILEACRILIATLPARATLLIVRAPASRPPGLRVFLRDRVLNDEELGVPLPIDPGPAPLRAEVDGVVRWERSLEFVPGIRAEVRIELSAETARVRAPAEGPSTRAPSPWGWVLAGVGAGSMIAGGVLWLLRDQAIDACMVDRMNNVVRCPSQSTLDNARNAESLHTAGAITLWSGGLLIAGGITWGVLELVRPGSREARAWRVTPTPHGIVLAGVFGR